MQELERLRHVVECQVFELCGPVEEHGSICYYVPYMMNDAVENYLVLRDCRLVGKFQPDFKGKQEAQIAEVKDGYVFAFRQGMENAFTLFFKSISPFWQILDKIFLNFYCNSFKNAAILSNASDKDAILTA